MVGLNSGSSDSDGKRLNPSSVPLDASSSSGSQRGQCGVLPG